MLLCNKAGGGTFSEKKIGRLPSCSADLVRILYLHSVSSINVFGNLIVKSYLHAVSSINVFGFNCSILPVLLSFGFCY
jgi:hypothetical protein